MAKPRVFVSSTYYDLSHAREHLERFIESMGYEAVLFESGDIPFAHDRTLDESCYAEIKSCHMSVLIIGGRYGSRATDSEAPDEKEQKQADTFFDSVTKREYLTARDGGTPLFVFVQRDVQAEYRTWKKNAGNTKIKWASVDSPQVFKFLDEVMAQPVNNFVRPFERLDDITNWLRDQWAGLFAEMLARKSTERTLKDLAARMADLEQVTQALKEYSEAVIRRVGVPDPEKLIEHQDKRIIETRISNFEKCDLSRFVSHCIATLIKSSKDIPMPTREMLWNAFSDSDDVEVFLKKLGISSSVSHNLSEYPHLQSYWRNARIQFSMHSATS